MRKETITLALLVSVLLLVNTLFMVIVQVSKTNAEVDFGGSLQANVIKGAFSLDGPEALFKTEVFETYIPEEIKDDKEEKEDIEVDIVTIDKTGEKIIKTPEGEEIILDYDNEVMIYNGREVPFIVDDFDGSKDRTSISQSPNAWVHLSYDRFEVYIEENYYNANTPEIDEFFDLFEPRYELMEANTGWSSEEFYDEKLEIYVTDSSGGCWGGIAYPTEAHIYFSSPLYKTECQKPYYENGEVVSNSGELGENWFYMSGALHESLHSINPLPIFVRSWLTEGFSEYNEYNILSEFEDINQETADYSIYHNGVAGYKWEDYVTNDYHDTTVYNREIQESFGYDIVAWMYSMLRDDYNLDFSDFYNLVEHNDDTLNYADSMWQISDYFTDMVVIDLFGRSIGYDFAEIKDVFEYDGPSGPGWGVRQWVDTSWYGDLNPVLSFSENVVENVVEPGQTATIIATVYNTGDVDLENVNVKIYSDEELIYEENVDVNENSYTEVQTSFSSDIQESFVIKAVVDEADLKIESNDNNNEDEEVLDFSYPPTAPILAPFSDIVVGEMNAVNIYPKATDLNGDDLTYEISSSLFSWDGTKFYWKTSAQSAGTYSFKVTVSDGELTDEETVKVIVENTCTTYDKVNKCWRGCECDKLNTIKKAPLTEF